MKCLLIIPAYNEAENITSVISEIRSLHPFIDIVVVDDGSSDATSWLAARAGVKVLKLPFNLGYGAAVQTGLIYGVEYGYDLCVLIDGDGQHDPQYIADLIAPSKRGRRTSRSARAFWARPITRYRWPAVLAFCYSGSLHP